MVSSTRPDGIPPGSVWGGPTPTHDVLKQFSVCLSSDELLVMEHVRLIQGALCTQAILGELVRECSNTDEPGPHAAAVSAALGRAALKVLDQVLILPAKPSS